MAPIERPLQSLSDSELATLWDEQPNATLSEWTFRMLERPSCMEDPKGFAKYLIMKRFEKSKVNDLVQKFSAVSPVEIGKTSFRDVTIRNGEFKSENYQLQAFRLLHLLENDQISIYSFLSGLRDALRAT